MPARPLTLLAALTALSPAAFADTAAVERTFLERSAISAADEKCGLFSEGERLALKSGLYQAEGELLRAKIDPGEIEQMSRDVRVHARQMSCDHPDVSAVAATVRSSYRQFSRTGYLEYPSGRSTWGASRSPHDQWAVSQTDKASSYVFGLHQEEKSPGVLKLAVAVPYDYKPPSSVKLFLRDPDKLPEPWLGTSLGGPPTATLAPPPKSVSRIEWASEMKEEENTVHDWFYICTFSPAAIQHIEALDPREAVSIEVTPSPLAKDQKVVRVVFEVGDLRAAHAFAMIPQPTPPAATAASATAPAEPKH